MSLGLGLVLPRATKKLVEIASIPDTTERQKAIGEFVNQNSSFLSEILQGIMSQIGKLDLTREQLQTVVLARLVGMGALSIAHVGSDFSDFAVGLSINRIFQPLEDAALTGPMTNWLKNYFRYNDISPRMLINAIETPEFSDLDLMESAKDAGIDDNGIRKLLTLKRIKEAKDLWGLWAFEDRVDENATIAAIEEQQSFIDAELRRLETEVINLFGDEEELALNNRIGAVNARIAQVNLALKVTAEPKKLKLSPEEQVDNILNLFIGGGTNERAARSMLLKLGLAIPDVTKLIEQAKAEIKAAKA